MPRPETEVVVERCLALLAGLEAPRVLDVGVGSGAIALAIADEHPGARVTAVDVSADALALARENAERLGWSSSCARAASSRQEGRWDLVVSNPPYVHADELPSLQPEVRDWEPSSRSSATACTRRSPRALAAEATWLVLEVGDGQASASHARSGARLRRRRITPGPRPGASAWSRDGVLRA